MKDNSNKKSKKKVLLYYLILAACLLVIAAVTVTVIFTVNRSKSPNLSIDVNNPNTPDDGNNDPDEGNKDPDDGNDNKPSGTTTDFLLPVDTASVTVAYEFGKDETLDRYCVHQGVDFEGTAGTSVRAALDGTVTKVIYHATPEACMYGGHVTISHANGVTTTYKFIDVKDGLKVGDTVSRGDIIGTISQAAGVEFKQGEHLHFEVAVNGKSANPENYLEIKKK